MSGRTDPHPVTGLPFSSPVRPGRGWPDDPANARTPVARDATQVVSLAAGSRTLSALSARSSMCRACPRLVAWRESVATGGRRASFAEQPYWGRPVPGFGDPLPHALVVGLAPAANGANRTGRNFTGDASGDFLYAALHRTGYANQPGSWAAGDGLVLTGIRIVATVRCAPPQNAPTPQERHACAPWLRRELDFVAPGLRSILALGAIGFAAAIQGCAAAGWGVPDRKPRFGHGVRVHLDRPDGAPVTLIGSYHVSPHNTFTGRLTPQMLDDVLRGL